MGKELIIQADGLKQDFSISDSYTIHAVQGVSFGIYPGEVLGLVGESGCGKSTVARILTGIYEPTAGQVLYEGIPINGPKKSEKQRKKMQGEVQLVFQDSAAALNPRMTVEKIVMEPLVIQNRASDKEAAHKELLSMLAAVGLDESYLTKYPEEISGGQRQRVAIARSLMLQPRLIIADEPIASMDVSIQAQIINLFRRLQREKAFAMLFIAHDLSVIRFISDRVGVMFQGKLVEIGPTKEVYDNPLHPYTKALLSAIHIPDPIYERQKQVFVYDEKTPLGKNMIDHGHGHFVLECKPLI